MVKFSEIRKTSEALKYVSYWRDIIRRLRSFSNLRKKNYHRCDLSYINTDF